MKNVKSAWSILIYPIEKDVNRNHSQAFGMQLLFWLGEIAYQVPTAFGAGV